MLEDSTLFRNLKSSLAVFRSTSTFEYYTLPVEVEEFSTISHVFHLLPLLQFFNKKDAFTFSRLVKTKTDSLKLPNKR